MVIIRSWPSQGRAGRGEKRRELGGGANTSGTRRRVFMRSSFSEESGSRPAAAKGPLAVGGRSSPDELAPTPAMVARPTRGPDMVGVRAESRGDDADGDGAYGSRGAHPTTGRAPAPRSTVN